MVFRSHMQTALEEARKAGARGEVPVGAVVADPQGRILARAGNRTRELNDPTAHAEILALGPLSVSNALPLTVIAGPCQLETLEHALTIAETMAEACAKAGSERLPGHTLTVTLEPCPMCAAAISFARIARLYYGAADPKSGGVAHGARIFAHPQCHHAPEIYDGIAADQAEALLKAFFAARRTPPD